MFTVGLDVGMLGRFVGDALGGGTRGCGTQVAVARVRLAICGAIDLEVSTRVAQSARPSAQTVIQPGVLGKPYAAQAASGRAD